MFPWWVCLILTKSKGTWYVDRPVWCHCRQVGDFSRTLQYAGNKPWNPLDLPQRTLEGQRIRAWEPLDYSLKDPEEPNPSPPWPIKNAICHIIRSKDYFSRTIITALYVPPPVISTFYAHLQWIIMLILWNWLMGAQENPRPLLTGKPGWILDPNYSQACALTPQLCWNVGFKDL